MFINSLKGTKLFKNIYSMSRKSSSKYLIKISVSTDYVYFLLSYNENQNRFCQQFVLSILNFLIPEVSTIDTICSQKSQS